LQAEHGHPRHRRTESKISQEKVMSMHTQLPHAHAAIGNWPDPMRSRIGNWPDPMRGRIGNWPDPMARAGSAANR
jgi:hypothetical protein